MTIRELQNVPIPILQRGKPSSKKVCHVMDLVMVTQCPPCVLLDMWDQYLALGTPTCLEGILFALVQFGGM